MRQLKLGRMLDTLPERLTLTRQRHHLRGPARPRRRPGPGHTPGPLGRIRAVRHDRTLWPDLTSQRFGNLGYRIRQSSGGEKTDRRTTVTPSMLPSLVAGSVPTDRAATRQIGQVLVLMRSSVGLG